MVTQIVVIQMIYSVNTVMIVTRMALAVTQIIVAAAWPSTMNIIDSSLIQLVRQNTATSAIVHANLGSNQTGRTAGKCSVPKFGVPVCARRARL